MILCAKSGVFYFIVDHLKNSLFKEMKANGYYTGTYPFNKGAYHSGHAYETLRVDRIIQPQELGYQVNCKITYGQSAPMIC